MFIVSKDHRKIVNIDNLQSMSIIENEYMSGARYAIMIDWQVFAYYTDYDEAAAAFDKILEEIEQHAGYVYTIE